MLVDMSLNEWLMSIAFFSSFAFITGWLTDRILLNAGFGTVGNWMLLLMGTYAGLFAVNLYGYEFDWFPHITIAAVIGSATLLFLFMCTLKRVFYF